jgi:hypothetical protein
MSLFVRKFAHSEKQRLRISFSAEFVHLRCHFIQDRRRHRLQGLKKDLENEGAPLLEQLLIQHAALCWLKLNLVELSYSNAMKQSITLTLGMYWEKRLTAAQKRFTRACETLTRVRRWSRNTPAVQVNIAADGGQQVNLSK